MNANIKSGEAFSPDLDTGAVSAQLGRLLSDSAFARSARQSDLLSYLVGDALEGGPTNIQVLRRELGGTNVLRGSLEQEAQLLVVNLQLVETDSGAVIWADRQTHAVVELLQFEDELALQIASQLSVQIQPDERAMIGASQVVNPEALVFYRQGGWSP